MIAPIQSEIRNPKSEIPTRRDATARLIVHQRPRRVTLMWFGEDLTEPTRQVTISRDQFAALAEIYVGTTANLIETPIYLGFAEHELPGAERYFAARQARLAAEHGRATQSTPTEAGA